MNITFSASELKKDEIDATKSNFSFIYLIAIADKHPNIWQQLKNVIANVDKKVKE